MDDVTEQSPHVIVNSIQANSRSGTYNRHTSGRIRAQTIHAAIECNENAVYIYHTYSADVAIVDDIDRIQRIIRISFGLLNRKRDSNIINLDLFISSTPRRLMLLLE